MKKVFLFVYLILTAFYTLGQTPRLVLPIGHSTSVESAVFSPDGKKVVSKSGNTSFIWETQSGHLLHMLENNSYVSSIDLSPDGKKILTASHDGITIVWELTSGKILRKLQTNANNSSQIEPDYGYPTTGLFSPDSKKIITGCLISRTAIIWDLSSGKKLYILTGCDSKNASRFNVNFSPDGNKVITADDFEIKIWSATNGKLLYKLVDDKNSTFISANFSSDSKKVITINTEGSEIGIWNAINGKMLYSYKFQTNYVKSACFSSDGKYVLIVSTDGTIDVIEVESGKWKHKVIDRKESVIKTNFSSDRKKIFTFSTNNLLTTWDLESGKSMNILKIENITEVNISHDFKFVVTIPSDENSAIIWDLESGRMLHKLQAHINLIKLAQYRPVSQDDSNFVKEDIIILSDSTITIWDALNGKVLKSLQANKIIHSIIISPDGKYIITLYFDDNNNYAAYVWDIALGKIIIRLNRVGRACNFSPNGKEMVTIKDNSAIVYDFITGEILHEFKNDYFNDIASLSFSPDGKQLVLGSQSNGIHVIDIESQKRLYKLYNNYDIIHGSNFNLSPDGKYIAAYDRDNDESNWVNIWEIASNLIIHKLYVNKSSINTANFSSDGKQLLTASDYSNIASVWRVPIGKIDRKYQIISKGKGISSASFCPNGSRILATSIDNICNTFSTKTGKLIYSFFLIDSTDYFTQIPTGYYKASLGATKLLHYVTKDLKVITFEQLDVKYNRPDKVLEAIGNTDTALINSYRKAWEKRIKKLGIDTTQFRDGYSVPEADFKNRDNIEYEQKNGILQLHISGVDSTYKLDRFNVWVNEAPLFGQRGISIKYKNKNNLDTIITIQLSQGENRIETSIINVNGTESYRMPLYVNYTPAIQQKEMAHFIGIGIDKFADNKFNLQYSSKDIRDLAIKLKEKYKDNIIIDTLFNENVTTTNVKKLKEKLLKTSVNDKVMISYSGHGLLSKDYDYYLSTYSVNFNKPEENGLPYDELENLLDSIPARKKLMLIDACHSGEVDKEEMQRYAQSENKLDTGIKGARKLELNNNSKLGMKNSFELMQNLFVNVGKSTGATIISAAAGTQFALERSDLKNGVFTYCILEEMKKNIPTTISQLKKTVGEQVEKMTNGLQKPTSRNETNNNDWIVW